jgi:DNA-binding NarL/FixJ family response regulator
MVPVRAPKTYSILLAHPLTLIREGLAALCHVQPQYRVLHQCSDGATALRLIESEKPEIAVLDFSLPDFYAMEIIHRLRKAQVSTGFVVLCARKDRRTVLEALRLRVNALVLESDPADCLLEALESTLDGNVYVSPSLEFNKLFSAERKGAQKHSLETLSAREYQVFSLLVEGTRAKEIGARLGLNPKTIDTYRVNLMRKLNIHSVAGLVKFAMQRDLIAAGGAESDPVSASAQASSRAAAEECRNTVHSPMQRQLPNAD